MRYSPLGKELAYAWEGSLPLDAVRFSEVPSALRISPDESERIERIREAWAPSPSTALYDGLLWRLEGASEEGSVLRVGLSPTSYAEHYSLRNIGRPMLEYPLPVGVSTLQETADGYLLLGVRGKGSERVGLNALGSGFIERKSGLPSLLDTLVRECSEETSYAAGSGPDFSRASALGIVLCSGHDAGIACHVPLQATAKDIGLGSSEHADLVLLPSKSADIERLLNEESYKGIPAPEDLLGLLELYLLNRSNAQP